MRQPTLHHAIIDSPSGSIQRVLLSLKIFFAHYRHAPLQAGATLLGIALAVTLLIGVKATNDNAIRSYSEATELLSQRADVLLTAPLGQENLDESVYFVLRQAGLSQSLAVVSGRVAGKDGQFWQIEGSDLIAALTLRRSQKNTDINTSLSLGELPLGELLSGEPLVVMGHSLASKIAPKGELELAHLTLKVFSIDDKWGLGSAILADISLAQSLLGLQGKLSYIALFSDRDKLADLKNQLDHLGITSQQASFNLQDQGQALMALTRSFHLNLNAMSMLAFVVGLFIAYNGVRYSLMKRQKLLIQLLQQGMERRVVMGALLTELTTLVVLGSTIGFILGLQLSHWLQPMVSMTLEQMYGAHLLPGVWQWTWLVQAIGLTLVAALAACLPLYVDLTRQSLAQGANRYQQTLAHSKIHRRQFVIACGLLCLAAILFPFSQSYNISLVLLGIVAVAIPLLLPQLLHWGVNGLLPLARPGLWQYLLAETRELIAPLSLAMMAILLALSANVSMNTLVGSFERTLRVWLDTRLHADLYIRPPTQRIAAVRDHLMQDPRINGLYQQWRLDAQLSSTGSEPKNIPVDLISRDEYSIKYTSVLKESLPKLWQVYFNGHYLLVSEPLAIKYQLQLGDTVTLDVLDKTSSNQVVIAGIYYDHGNTRNEVIISHTLWQQAQLPTLPISLAASFYGKDKHSSLNEAELEQVQMQLATELDLAQAQIYSQTKIKTQAISIFKRTFSITLVLNSLTLLVAAIGLFSASLMLTQARQAPLARLYSLGVSRSELRYMVFIQMLLVVLITCLIAMPTGALLGYLLINKITLQAFGWTIKMIWDWQTYGHAILIALTTCTLAVILPLYWQTRKPLVSSLQQETL
ncbi:ABC transporter permease [Shewanella sp. HN-41]|uniref:ABC transporter permease n=1 Tax=Shewanella sp. HN-41 TaxID=327275 RepID=UPI0002125FD4|nr:FtsX-like permease family protein [Shewanella sp. HN-41]EGM71459.1 AttF component of AttEFGH ABC transport system [Shewanella sp. HN-41]